ncbi:hypothetical protein [Endozoicomonas sp. 4G]|uniref:hypothetical protein n=1 Tax=Endozoicomonas sp. 4G TaxID=2872754 RepID=UPI002078AB20|nr:hypothetical protein [Endozoicomonas sp. 4G]
MTNARLCALTLAVSVAISSSVMATQAQADRRLQIKSVGILGNEPVEFIHSEAAVKPTLDHDQQPIPGSFTTTYPAQTQAGLGYDAPSKGFTEILSGIEGGVSSVDTFQTGENGVAQKYTRVLKVADEQVFRFIHDLAKSELVIEVRDGMTDQASVEAVRAQSDDIQPLDPLTKIASPEQLAGVLKGANERAGNLGASHHYVSLATIRVNRVEVNGRTFMRLIATGDQPPELQRLGQSLFINDEVLLAAATSAYTQVYVLEEALQHEALCDLLSHHKPVGYVVHVEDETQAHSVPANYPKLEVEQALDEVIVFRGQKQNPTDVAFVESHYHFWRKFKFQELIAGVKKDKIKSYQYVIRSRQMALLEKFAAAVQHEAKLDENELSKLVYYESLQQALASATPDGTDEFEFRTGYIRVASSIITPLWIQFQLFKNFSFKPALKSLLTNHHFVQNIYTLVPIITEVMEDPANRENRKFSAKVTDDISEQMLEIVSTLARLRAKLRAREAELKAIATSSEDLEKAAYFERLKLAELDKVIHRSRTLNRPEGRPLVLSKLADLEQILKIDNFNSGDDVYQRRDAISQEIKAYITKTRQKAEQKALNILETAEEVLGINLNEGDDNLARLDRARTKLEGDDVSESMLDTLVRGLGIESFTPAGEKRETKLEKLHWHLTLYVGGRDGEVIREQERLLKAIEDKLRIRPILEDAVTERGKAFMTKLANDLRVIFEKDAPFHQNKYALEKKIWELIAEVDTTYSNENVRRARNNEIAHQLNIEAYENDATINDQNIIIKEKLQHLEQEVSNAGIATIDDHITAIDAELDEEMTLLGPKPRYVLEREAARARRAVKEADTSQADIERMKDVLKAAEKAIEDDGGPSQYTPEQEETLDAIQTFTGQHSLKRQALEAAIGLAELAVANGRVMPDLTAFDFDGEQAPVYLRALVGDGLAFAQAYRMVKVFKGLQATFPIRLLESKNVLKDVQQLMHRARGELGKGAEHYDKDIRAMGETAVHFVDYEPDRMKSVSEYLATRCVSAKKIIALLRQGLISKVELENHIKAVRRVGGYQTVAEFEHFIFHRQRINLPHFDSIIEMLPDKDAEEFMQSIFTPVIAAEPTAMKESVAGMKEYAAAVIANYVLDDIAFENGRRTAAFLTNIQDTLTPYANAAGLSESDLIKVIHDTLMQAHATAVERQLFDYWVRPSAFLVQAKTWYYTSYKPLLVTRTALEATEVSLVNMSLLYLLDLTNRGDYLHRMLIPFQHWLEHSGVDPDRTGQYAYHNGIEQITELGGLAMPLGKAASSAILLQTGSELFARQYSANPQMYRSIFRLVPEMVKSMGSGQGVQIPLLHRMTPQTVKTLASATAGLALGPIATVGAYAHGLISGFTYAQTLGFALASSLTFDFFMNDNKMLTQWLGGPLGRSLDRMNRWWGEGETDDNYMKRTAIASPQGFNETDEAYANRVQASNRMYGWTRHENYLQFRERRDRTMKLFENGWEQYFKENVPKWSFSHAESVPYFYMYGVFHQWQWVDDQKAHSDDERNAPQSSLVHPE